MKTLGIEDRGSDIAINFLMPLLVAVAQHFLLSMNQDVLCISYPAAPFESSLHVENSRYAHVEPGSQI